MNTGTHPTNDFKAAARTPRADDFANTAGAYSSNGSQSLPLSGSAAPSANTALMDQQRPVEAVPQQVTI